MPTKTLTDRFVASVRTERRVNFFDTKARGLALRVTPSGIKTWTFVYRRPKGKPQWLFLGEYGEPPRMGLKDARERAIAERVKVNEGRDPVAERKAEREPKPAPERPFTFGDLVPVYEQAARRRIAKKTVDDHVRKIDRWLLPYWKDKPLREITRTDVTEVLDRISAAKTKRAPEGLTAGVNRVQTVISRLFYVALDRGLIEAHPAVRVEKRHGEEPRDRVLTDDELRGLWKGLKGCPGRAADVVKLRMLFGQRLEQELMPMRWEEIDFDEGLWVIPRERTKNRKQPHAVPLGATALEMLKTRRATVANEEARVFPNLSGNSAAYRDLAPLQQGFSWIDLRRTLATRLAGLGFSETTIGRVLNHAKVTVTSRHYNKYEYLPEKRQALEAWDRELGRILRNEPKTGADVVAIETRRNG